ncbi:MAG: imidazole glycerol phosphate synthase subunit HisH [Candidatus Hydrogenedens sp.]|nr:imidazole glycerol phosphate synthase subunit HisH [Candidatus Hydrogenedens sp.]
MIAIVDYGLGNLHSAQKGFEQVGLEAVLSDDPARIADADAVVLPGVGAYGDCLRGLESKGLFEPVRDAALSGRPFLGICVGFQLMFEGSEEGNVNGGLGIFRGRIARFPRASETGLKVPHMGWNQIRVPEGKSCALLPEGVAPYFYFVHSYYAVPEDPSVVLAECDYGVRFPAIVGQDRVFACQFHPEKSQTAGLSLLKAFGGQVQAAAV